MVEGLLLLHEGASGLTHFRFACAVRNDSDSIQAAMTSVDDTLQV